MEAQPEHILLFEGPAKEQISAAILRSTVFYSNLQYLSVCSAECYWYLTQHMPEDPNHDISSSLTHPLQLKTFSPPMPDQAAGSH